MNSKPVSQAELARAWGLSRARISQYCKSGMPLVSLEKADAWRTANYPMAVKNETSGSKKNQTSAELKGTDQANQPEKIKESDVRREDLIGTLARLKKNEMIAWSMLAQTVNNLRSGVSTETEVSTRMRHYKDAVGLRIAQEGEVDQILMRRRELVTLADAQELFGRHLQALRLSLRPLPRRIASRCNPSDPKLAYKELKEAIEKIFKIMNEWKI